MISRGAARFESGRRLQLVSRRFRVSKSFYATVTCDAPNGFESRWVSNTRCPYLKVTDHVEHGAWLYSIPEQFPEEKPGSVKSPAEFGMEYQVRRLLLKGFLLKQEALLTLAEAELANLKNAAGEVDDDIAKRRGERAKKARSAFCELLKKAYYPD